MQPLPQDSEVKGHSLDLITIQCNLNQKVKQIFNCPVHLSVCKTSAFALKTLKHRAGLQVYVNHSYNNGYTTVSPLFTHK